MKELYDKIKDKIYIPLIISVILVLKFTKTELWCDLESNAFGFYFIKYQKFGFCRDGLMGSILGLLTDDLSLMYMISNAFLGLAAWILLYVFSTFCWKCTDNLNLKALFFGFVFFMCPLFFNSQSSVLIVYCSLFGMIALVLLKQGRCLWVVPILSVVATLTDVDYVMTFFGIVVFAFASKILEDKNVRYVVSGCLTVVSTMVAAIVCNLVEISKTAVGEYLFEIKKNNMMISEMDRFSIDDSWFDFYYSNSKLIWHIVIPLIAVIAAYVVKKYIVTDKMFRMSMLVCIGLLGLGTCVDGFWASVIPVFLLYICCSEGSTAEVVEVFVEKFKKLGFVGYLYLVDIILFFEIMFSKQIIVEKIVSYILVLMSTIIFVKVKKSTANYAKKYLMLVVPISLATTLLVTPTYYINSPDEGRHYTRIYSISMGQLFPNAEGEGVVNLNIEPKDADGSYTLPSMVKSFNQPVDYDSYEYVNFYGAAIYPFLGYIPQVIALCITKLFTNNAYLLMYGTRFGSWILSVFIIYCAIKKTPMYKKAFMSFALTSMILREMVTINVDGVSFACSLLLLAEVMYYIHNENEKVNLKDKIIIFLLGVFLALSKTLYAPLILVVCALNKTNFMSRFGKNAYATFVFLGAVSIALIWVASVGNLIDGTTEGYGVDGAKQTEYILSDIGNYIKIMLVTIKQNGMNWFHDMFGRKSQRYLISLTAIVAGEIAVFVSILKEKAILKGKKFVVLSLVAGFVVVVCSLTGEYIQFTKVGASVVLGVQGRYFVPIYLFVAISIAQLLHRLFGTKKISEKVSKYNVVITDVAKSGFEDLLFYYYIVITIMELCVINI